MNLITTVFVPKGLSKKKLDDYQKRGFRQFYLRPRTIFSYIKRIVANPRIFWVLVKSGLGFVRGTL